jgi:XapX domain-containing protein
MKPYLIALAVGLLAGCLYGLLAVKSPAPPVISLIGLLGILLGEQIAPIARRVIAGEPLAVVVASASAAAMGAPLPSDASTIAPHRIAP